MSEEYMEQILYLFFAQLTDDATNHWPYSTGLKDALREVHRDRIISSGL
jgi:hypothetical protein